MPIVCLLYDGTDWQEVDSARGFDHRENEVIESPVVFKDSLVASNYNSDGMEMWQSTNGTTWIQVNFAGFGDSNNNTSFYDKGTVVFADALYVSSYNSANGGQVWKYLDSQVLMPAIIR